MAPTLLPGDRLYIDPKAFRERPPAPGELVVARDPTDPHRLVVKRVASPPGEPSPSDVAGLPAKSLYLLGDDPAVSRDSRSYGPVPLASVVGLVWFRYAPPGRRGPLTATFK